MKFLPLTASLMALALFSAPAFAQDEAPAQEQPAVEAAPQVPEEVLVLLNDARPLSELSVDELGARAKQARNFSKMKGLPGETRDQLQAIAQAARSEIAAREQQAAQPTAPAAEQPVVEAPVEQPAVEAPAEQPAETAAPATVELPPDVANLLNDQRPLSELSAEELDHRFKTARQFSKAKKLPDETKAQLSEIVKAARQEMMARETAAQKVPEPLVQPETAEQPPATAQPPAAEPPAVVEQPPIVEQPPVVEAQPPAAAPADAKQSQQLDGNAAVPEAEAKAKVYLDDATPADKLSDADLRKRLDGIRELMAGNELSRQTEQALRKKLRVEREILRNRVAVAEPPKPTKPDGGDQPASKPSKINKRDYTFNIDIVLNDRRPSDELQDYELRRRLEVYRQYDRDERYGADQRAYWREVRQRDEALLQQRLIRERRQRQAELASQYEDDQYDVELGEGYDPNQQDDVYAAEVDDEELEDVLVAAPRRKIDRRYTVEEVEASPDLREALPRIEIDTVRFGFNEAFVRPEEVGNLDRIGEIMERVLSKHPREVFLIEGHTDAVGSDASNLTLSRQRAAAIKKALTTYYVIEPQNLQTVGYGERYLKIPTAEAEQENRRVSVSRATSVLGELEE
jgi:outer membrane protein OmpA-like peptidoglycan-associated protein